MTPPVPPTPEVAAAVFGGRLELAEAYIELLADTGISHGLIGPREAPRLWDRHVLNSAVVHPVFGHGSVVADVGSGAGLPGIPLAIVRPDLRLVLIEPLLRRTVWLTSTVAALGLTNVEVRRGRAESLWGQDRFHHITARAVARIGELARIGLPLLNSGGSLHALKGENAVTELAEDAAEVRSLGATRWDIVRFGEGVIDPETVVVSVHIDSGIDPVPPERALPGSRAGRGRRGASREHRRRPPLSR